MRAPSTRGAIVGKTLQKIVTTILAVGILVGTFGGVALALAAGLPGFAATIAVLQALAVGTLLHNFAPEIDTGGASRQLAENLSIYASATAVRAVPFGRVGVAGQILFRENIKNNGDTPDELLLILGLAGYPATSLEKFWFNEELVFDGDSTTGPGAITSGVFADDLWVWFRTGEEVTAAFPEIAALSTSWDARVRKLRGIPSIGIRIKITEKVEGRLQPLAQIKGAKLYDPRLDSTIPGGSGAHRFADPATWEFSVNPKLAELIYLRGAEVESTRIFGMGKAAAAIDLENFASEASICEEQIDVVGGGTIDRYTCNGLLILSSNHKTNLLRLLSASAGTMDASGGIYRTFAGAWKASSMTLTESDIDGAPTEIQLQIDQSAEVNVISGSFADPADMWVVKEYPELTDSASIALFGENSKKLDLPFTIDHRMAQRISKIQMLRLNAKRAFNANYWLRAASLQPGDIVTQTYVRYGITSETFRIDFWALEAGEDRQSNRRLVVSMRLVEEQQSWFDWDEATEEQSTTTITSLPSTDRAPAVVGDTQSSAIGETIDGPGRLTDDLSALEGSTYRSVTRGTAPDAADDGDAITFDPVWTVTPEVNFLNGGVSFNASLSGDQVLALQALNLSGSGFTADLKIKELAGAITDRTDSTVSTPSVPAGLDHSINKDQTDEAWDDKYTFQYDVSFSSPPGEPETVTVGFYTNDGGGWVQRATQAHVGDSGDPDLLNQTKTVVVDGLGLDDDFGLERESAPGTGSITFDNVKYGTATEPTTETATPAGSSSIEYLVIGG